MDSPQSATKPSFFRTLPDNIAQSPTGITRISNSPFPTLVPNNGGKSVYERAGFDVYKGDRNSPINDYKIRGLHEPGIRSHSTSHLIPERQLINNKRNVTESHEYNPQTVTRSQPNLIIDSKLANRSFQSRKNSYDQVTGDSKSPNSMMSTGPQHTPIGASTANSSRFDLRSTHSQSPVKSLNQAVSMNATLRSLPSESQSFASSPTHTALYPGHRSRESPAHSTPSSNHSSSFEDGHFRLSRAPSPSKDGHDEQHRFSHCSPKRHSAIESIVVIPEGEVDLSISSQQKGLSPSHKHIPTGHSLIPHRAPPPSLSPLVPHQDKEYEDKSGSFNSVSFTPNPTITIEPSFDSPDVENDIQPLSDDEHDVPTFNVLEPRNQHFNFENQSLEDLNDDDDSDDEIVSNPEEPTLSSAGSIETQPVHMSTLGVPSTAQKKMISSPEDGSLSSGSQIQTPFTPNLGYQFDQNSSPTSNYGATPKRFTIMDARQPFEELDGDNFNPSPFNTDSIQPANNHSILYNNQHSPLQVQVHSLKPSGVSAHSAPLQHGVSFAEEPLGEKQLIDEPLEEVPLREEPLREEPLREEPLEEEPIQQEKEIKYPPGEGPCRKCGLEIESKPIYSKSGELSGQWHRSCFTCSSCDLKFNKDVNCFVLNDNPYCENHFHVHNNSLCKICGLGIVGKCLEIDAMSRYHEECLVCTVCDTAITSDYVSINGAIHCENCAMSYARMNDNNTKMERRRTRIGFI